MKNILVFMQYSAFNVKRKEKIVQFVLLLKFKKAIFQPTTWPWDYKKKLKFK